jgi:hypothetical protein
VTYHSSPGPDGPVIWQRTLRLVHGRNSRGSQNMDDFDRRGDADRYVLRLRFFRLYQRRVRPEKELHHISGRSCHPDAALRAYNRVAVIAPARSSGRIFWNRLFFRIWNSCSRTLSDGHTSNCAGFTFNMGRFGSAIAPFWVGSLADTHGFSTAFGLLSAAFAVGAMTWIWLPETRGRKLT